MKQKRIHVTGCLLVDLLGLPTDTAIIASEVIGNDRIEITAHHPSFSDGPEGVAPEIITGTFRTTVHDCGHTTATVEWDGVTVDRTHALEPLG